ncbi:MAG: hypothetical protein SFU25_10820 [Candidatus Caenarcaniphilales bacterium]|nr:hypothetical protein [Candidatus Caenarcaniphilales bacterium]
MRNLLGASNTFNQFNTENQIKDFFLSSSLLHDFTIPIKLIEQENNYQKALEKKRPMVAVYDSFAEFTTSNREVNFHGDAIEAIIHKESNENPFVLKADSDLTSLTDFTKDILRRIKNEKANIKALNISTFEWPGTEITISLLIRALREAGLNYPIKEDGSNLYEFKEEIRNFIMSGNKPFLALFGGLSLLQDRFDSSNPFKELILNIEELEANGCQVYLAAGNDGKDTINLLSFAKGITTTGAKENGQISEYSAQNSMINNYESALLPIRYTIDTTTNEVNFDAFADGEIEATVLNHRSEFGLADEEQHQNMVEALLKMLETREKLLQIQDKSSEEYKNILNESEDLKNKYSNMAKKIFEKDTLNQYLNNNHAFTENFKEQLKQTLQNYPNKYVYFPDPKARITENNNKIFFNTEWNGTSFASPRALTKIELN